MVKIISWMMMETLSQMLVHSKFWSLPTIMRNDDVAQQESPNWVISRCWTKLWVFPPLTRSTTWWLEMRPTNRIASGAKWPAKKFRLIWAG